jgi:hypothetical protein
MDRRALLGSPGHPARSSAERPLVSVVVPAFNEVAGILATIRILSATLQACDCEPEIVVVDDGSRDATFERTAELSDIGLPVRVCGCRETSARRAPCSLGSMRLAARRSSPSTRTCSIRPR